jgi:hypothetical protein
MSTLPLSGKTAVSSLCLYECVNGDLVYCLVGSDHNLKKQTSICYMRKAVYCQYSNEFVSDGNFSLNWNLSVVCKVFNPCLTKIWNIYHVNFRSVWVLTNPVIVCGTSGVAMLIMSCGLNNHFLYDSELKCRRYSIFFLYFVMHYITIPNTLQRAVSLSQ